MNQYEIELRDRIAFAKMQALLDARYSNEKDMATCAYDFADAMMIERDEPKEYIQDKIKQLLEAQDAGRKIQGTECDR